MKFDAQTYTSFRVDPGFVPLHELLSDFLDELCSTKPFCARQLFSDPSVQANTRDIMSVDGRCR